MPVPAPQSAPVRSNMLIVFLRYFLVLNVVLLFLPAACASEPLHGGVEHSDTVPAAPLALMPGIKFDEDALPKLTPGNNWLAIPNWFAGTWQYKTETVTRMRLYTKDPGYPSVPFTLKNEFKRTHGQQKDKSGQIWDYIKVPYSYTTKVDNGYLGYERTLSVDIVKCNEDEVIRKVFGPDSVVDPDTQEILLTQQKQCVSRYTKFGDDAVHLDSSTKIFDMQGSAKLLKISEMVGMRVKPYEEIDEQDGRNLKQSFAQFLTSIGKKDLIP